MPTDDPGKGRKTQLKSGATAQVPDIELVSQRIRERARHLLNREAIVGSSTPNKVTGTDGAPKSDRINEEEAIGRLLRLLGDLEDSEQRLATAGEDVASALDPDTPEILLHLTPTEIRALYDGKGTVKICVRDAGELLAQLEESRRKAQDAVYELKRILSGHYGKPPRPGRAASRRGKEFAAQLLGYAEGFGLAAAGDRSKYGVGAAAEAIARAFSEIVEPSDPVAKAVYAQIPRTHLAIENLSRECGHDDELSRLRAAGQRLSQRSSGKASNGAN